MSPKGTTSVLAKAQDAHGIAVGLTKTYWVIGVFHSGDDGNDIGVIRSEEVHVRLRIPRAAAMPASAGWRRRSAAPSICRMRSRVTPKT
ncbi:MAG: hypothetical protein U0235_19875 [Polyangiaceae bacterium]